MFEIEAKVHISKADFKRLKDEILKIAKYKKQIKNVDCYFGNIDKQFFLRTREQDNKSFIHLKTKKREKGIEMNQEIELPVISSSKIHVLFKKIGIPLTARKEKVSDYYQYKDMVIELNFVKGLGYFLEIETIVQSKSQIPKAKKALRELFSQLGFKPSDFERKYYLELLAEKRKNKSE